MNEIIFVAIDKYVTQLGDIPMVSGQAAQRFEPHMAALTCNFEPNEPCAWGNLPGGALLWKRVRFKEPKPSKNQMKSITSKSETPEGAFAVIGSESGRGEGENYVGSLVATIPCQKGPGKLSFDHWTNSQSNDLTVCVVPMQSSEEKRCIGSVRRTSPNPIRFTIPAPDDERPFQESILKKKQTNKPENYDNTEKNVNILRNITSTLLKYSFKPTLFKEMILPNQFNENSLPSDRKFPTAPVVLPNLLNLGRLLKPTAVKPKPNQFGNSRCVELLSCDFESGTSCFYDVKASRNGQWNVGSGRTGNRLTGIRVDGSGNARGYYAFVGRDYPDVDGDTSSKQSVYILQSPETTFKKAVKLYYDVFLKSSSPELKVCINDLSVCPKVYTLKNVRSTSDGWLRRESIMLNPSSKRVMFIVKSLPANQYVALDNIAIENGQNAC
ncbi:MAM domain protein [Trichinella nativa]|uniref:MAM domain protein n=1 Tax=Trichinella nativa TaxID=6335 RepID=A0A1Y3EMG8_9BILA|nr:MAM domain protein [Trichinella nativa]